MRHLLGLAGIVALVLAASLLRELPRDLPPRIARHLDGPALEAARRGRDRLDADCLLAFAEHASSRLRPFVDTSLVLSVTLAATALAVHAFAAVEGAVLLPLVVVTAVGAQAHLRAHALRRRLETHWLAELSYLHTLTSGGSSLLASLEERAAAPTPWARAWSLAIRFTDEGHSPLHALERVATLLRNPTLTTSLRLLGAAWEVGTVARTLEHLEQLALLSRRTRALQRASRREQVVWIPVAVAAGLRLLVGI